MAEYLGTVIALNLLFGIPMIYAAVFGALDVILILALTTRKFRVLEQVFTLLISVSDICMKYLSQSQIRRLSYTIPLFH